MVLRLCFVLCCCLPLLPAVEDDPARLIEVSVAALRSGDLPGWLERLPQTQRQELERVWNQLRRTPLKPARIGSTNMLLMMLTAPRAADHLMTLIEPQLATLEGAELALLLDHWNRWLVGLRNRLPPCMTRDNVDVVLSLMPELRAWSETSALDDPERVHQALVVATAWLRAQEIRSVQQLYELDLTELAVRAETAVAMVKEIAALYHIDCDAFLDSVEVDSSGEGDQRTLQVDFVILGQRRSVERRVERVGDGWMPLFDDDLVALDGGTSKPKPSDNQP